mgnify:CR=1 FL=1
MSRGELEPVLGIAVTVALFYWFMTYVSEQKKEVSNKKTENGKVATLTQ